VASAAPHNVDPLIARRLERAGAAAIVLPSLFEEEILVEQVELDRSLEQGTNIFAEALDYFPAVRSFAGTADRYVTALRRVKASVTIPVIASLNASSAGG
jgi:dihydroorotate dehydrogenase (fumarate)